MATASISTHHHRRRHPQWQRSTEAASNRDSIHCTLRPTWNPTSPSPAQPSPRPTHSHLFPSCPLPSCSGTSTRAASWATTSSAPSRWTTLCWWSATTPTTPPESSTGWWVPLKQREQRVLLQPKAALRMRQVMVVDCDADAGERRWLLYGSRAHGAHGATLYGRGTAAARCANPTWPCPSPHLLASSKLFPHPAAALPSCCCAAPPPCCCSPTLLLCCPPLPAAGQELLGGALGRGGLHAPETQPDAPRRPSRARHLPWVRAWGPRPPSLREHATPL